MTTVVAPTRPARRSAPQPRPAQSQPRHLRVVRPDERPRRRVTPLGAVALTCLVFATLFAVAVAHTVLVQGQMRLDRIDAQLTAEQARYQELRTTVAELESPERIVTAAEARGMVSPTALVYLQPSSPDPTAAPADGSTDAGAAAGSRGAVIARDASRWSDIKPLLDSARP